MKEQHPFDLFEFLCSGSHSCDSHILIQTSSYTPSLLFSMRKQHHKKRKKEKKKTSDLLQKLPVPEVCVGSAVGV